MALLPIRLYGDPVLRRKSVEVPEVSEEIQLLARDMLETMYDADGVGLAAPQVGRSIRMLVADASHKDGGAGGRVFINPVILEAWGELSYDEGCLSVPGLSAELVRPEAVRVRFQDETGATREEEFHRLWGRVLQHEIDHLEGKLFVDYLSPIKRALIMKKLKQLQKEAKSGIAL
ncbi:MAG: peptide deformylase [Candidatus Eisenbacteria bacterium]|nr:peptide deformylase [Candidatus Eisenbacteria bacterium]MCC7144620.1 peptide deformylase [Candidatus Eisenbacteria bacterium]